jgi:hypothetical protein
MDGQSIGQKAEGQIRYSSLYFKMVKAMQLKMN